MKAIAILFPCLLLTACATGMSERDELPTGVTLLETIRDECESTVYLEDDVAIERGKSVVVEVEEFQDIDWECLGDPAADVDDFDCPAGTDYIRVIRQADEDEFTVECFG